ncbi:MAG TPA: hypothetical protein ENK99_03820 [Campylobacterales bacterium]|nr:hypothetical protein [Campylobacterales bacterium]HHH51266.1 hypothetical protein [Campylobacterales bacterium]
MNIQDGIKEVKKEFTTDEQMLVSAFKLEKFYKKNKIAIFVVAGLVVAFFSGKAILEAIENSRLNSANDAYLVLQKDEKNTQALDKLKSKNPELFELYSYNQAVKNRDTKALKTLSSSKNEFISDMSRYHLYVLEAKETNSELYKDFALVNNAYIYIKDGKMEEAKNQLALIDEKSPVYNISKIIKHYTIKGK